MQFSHERYFSGDNGNQPPLAIAGPDQLIILPTQEFLSDGTVSFYLIGK
jgi:hypothetical protein